MLYEKLLAKVGEKEVSNGYNGCCETYLNESESSLGPNELETAFTLERVFSTLELNATKDYSTGGKYKIQDILNEMSGYLDGSNEEDSMDNFWDTIPDLMCKAFKLTGFSIEDLDARLRAEQDEDHPANLTWEKCEGCGHEDCACCDYGRGW